MSTDRQQLESAIGALEAQRALLGDAMVDEAVARLRATLAALDAQPATDAPEAILRQVTVVFVDIGGSTELGRQLDPEDAQEVMDGALARFTTIVTSHGGRVLQYVGDGLLAAFGADEAHEDDAEQAVHAGLALLAEGRLQQEQVLRRHRHEGFAVRIGAHTGAVLLNAGVDDEGSIRGITVNIAARMEQTAPAGRLRISHDTYRHVRGVFDVEPQPPIVIKGVDEPVVTYLVVRAKPRAFRVASRGIEGVETRMVGRDAELEDLQDAFKSLYTDGRLRMVAVTGDAGIGKSRLLDEFRNWAESRAEPFYIFQGRASPQLQTQPYGLLRDVLAWRLQIADADTMATAKQKVEDGIVPLFVDEDGPDLAVAHAHLLGHLVGLDFSDSRHIGAIHDDGKQIRNRGFHAAAQIFRRVASRGSAPVVLLLDDLHWADEGSLDFLDYLMQVDRDVPMLIVGLARPSLHERRTDWPAVPDARRITLAPLDRTGSRLLANELLQKLPDIPSTLRELVTGGGEGNPFYMEELVKMLIDERAIETDGPGWRLVPERLMSTHVPATLTGVLQSRLDGLRPAEKLALQQASVIGFTFWDEALAAIDARAPDALHPLARRELVLARHDAAFDGVHEYTFKNQILQHVTYDTVLKRIRREVHGKVAVWLSSLEGARANDFLGATADHFEKAGECVRAAEYFTRAAENAAGRHAHSALMSYVERAIACLAAVPADEAIDQRVLRWRLFDARERTLDLQGKRDEQRADIDALQSLADALDDDRRRGEVAWRRADFALRTSDFQAMERAARDSMAFAARAGETELGLRAQQRLALAIALGRLDDLAGAKSLATDGLAKSRAQRLRRVEARFLNALMMIATIEGDPVTARDMAEAQLAIERELGNRPNEAQSLCNLGRAWFDLGKTTEARAQLEDGLKLIRAVGDRAVEPYVLISLCDVALRRGEDAVALAQAQAAVDIAVLVGDRLIEATAWCCLGHAELALGREDSAAAAYRRADAVAREIDSAHRFDALAGLARVALARDDVDEARRAIAPVLAHRDESGSFEATGFPRRVALTCAQVLACVDDARADLILESAHDELQAFARSISDPKLRESFLREIPEHREIVAAWSASSARATVA